MDWSNERYVRVYVRDTDDWIALSWEARALLLLLLRAVDRAGVLQTRRGARGVAGLLRMPNDVVERALAELLADGCIQVCGLGYIVPNFIAAQEAIQSDTQRKRESRGRRRDLQLADGIKMLESGEGSEAGHDVTNRDRTSEDDAHDGQEVTTGHAASRPVTRGHSYPDPDPDPDPDLNQAERASPRARDPRTPGTGLSQLTAAAGDVVDRRELGDRTWARLNELRRTLAADLCAELLPLNEMDPGRRELALRIRDAGDLAAKRCDHVLAVLEADARGGGDLKWVSGLAFTEGAWALSCAKQVSRAPPLPSGPSTPHRNHPVSDSLEEIA